MRSRRAVARRPARAPAGRRKQRGAVAQRPLEARARNTGSHRTILVRQDRRAMHAAPPRCVNSDSTCDVDRVHGHGGRTPTGALPRSATRRRPSPTRARRAISSCSPDRGRIRALRTRRALPVEASGSQERSRSSLERSLRRAAAAVVTSDHCRLAISSIDVEAEAMRGTLEVACDTIRLASCARIQRSSTPNDGAQLAVRLLRLGGWRRRRPRSWSWAVVDRRSGRW